MVDRYYRKIEENLSKIDTNLEKINDNGNSILNTLKKIDNFTQYVLKSSKDFEKNL